MSETSSHAEYKKTAFRLLSWLLFTFPLAALGHWKLFESQKTLPQWWAEKSLPSMLKVGVAWLTISALISAAYYGIQVLRSRRRNHEELKAFRAAYNSLTFEEKVLLRDTLVPFGRHPGLLTPAQWNALASISQKTAFVVSQGGNYEVNPNVRQNLGKLLATDRELRLFPSPAEPTAEPLLVSNSFAERAATPALIDDSATQFKVLPAIDLEPYRSNTNRILRPGIFLAYDALDTSSTDHRLFFASKLRIRFDNQDANLGAVRRVTVFLRRESEAGEGRETQIGAALIRDVATRAKFDLDNFQIQPLAVTPYYELDCDAELAKDWARLLDDNCFVRVKVEAVRQPPYCIDLNVDWETARLTNSPAGLSLRRCGLCQEVTSPAIPESSKREK